MLRLAHRILSQNIKTHRDSPECLAAARDARDQLDCGMHVIIADNVSQYLADCGKDSITADDFPMCRSPFPRVFIEWTMDIAQDTPEGVQRLSHNGAYCISMTRAQAIANGVPHLEGHNEDVETVQLFSLWAAVNGCPEYIDAVALFALRKDGSPKGFVELSPGPFPPGEAVLSFLSPAFLALSFLNCKNVKQIDRTEQEGPPEKWLRRMRQPRINYHVLEIDPMKQVLRTEGGSDVNGLKKALHICRGHFATYTEEKPLFGHTVGTVWRPSHVRGARDQGAVFKDYAVTGSKV